MASATKKNSPSKNKGTKRNSPKLNISKFLGRGTNVKFVKTNSGWDLSGKNTYNWKDNVKALGAKWTNKTWKLPQTAKLGPLRKILATLKKQKKPAAKLNPSISKHLGKGVDIQITRIPEGWSIKGKSAYDWREEIKQLGGRWNGSNREWIVSGSVAPLRHLLASLKRKLVAKQEANALKAFNPPWRCCDKMTIYSFTQGNCPIHCPDGSMTARGCYTGD